MLRNGEDEARKRVAATQPIPGIRAQDMKLWMPSQIGRGALCDEGLYEYEYDLRKGQAFEGLDEMRSQLLVRTHEYKYKDSALRGVKAMTRSGTRIKGIDGRIERAAEQYRAARSALVSLGSILGRQDWQQHLRPLNASDIRGRSRPSFGDEERQRGGKKKKARLDPEAEERLAAEAGPLSWIWVSQGGSAEDEELVDNEGTHTSDAGTRHSLNLSLARGVGQDTSPCAAVRRGGGATGGGDAARAAVPYLALNVLAGVGGVARTSANG